MRALAFCLGNLVAGWLLAGLLGSQLHYPEDIPLRLQPQSAAVIIAGVFSLLGLPIAGFVPRLRTPLIVLSMPLSIAAAGAALFSLDRAAGARIALSLAQHSPLVLAAGAAWGLVWSYILYHPVSPGTATVPTALPIEDLPVSDQWSGAER